MKINPQTVLSYDNFEALTHDIVSLAKEVMPEKAIYINFLNNDVQVTMRVSKHDTKVNVVEGETIPVLNAVCNQIDYVNNKPLILNDAHDNDFPEDVKETIRKGNLGSYLGIPILFQDGTRFGALCAAHHDKSEFDDRSVELLQKIANLFSYYLELEHLAYQDALTKLNNSQYLISQYDNILLNGGVSIMIDLDNFKNVNDTLGHDIGDEVLKEVGRKLSLFTKAFQHALTVRLGGDEFYVYIKDKKDDDAIKECLERLLESLTRWETNLKGVRVSSSIGTYRFKKNEFTDFKDLHRVTDELLYAAKGNGKNTYVLK